MRVFFSAGEASGDAYAAALVRAMRQLTGEAEFTVEGIGGKRLCEVATGSVLDSSKWGAISISQVLAMAPRFIAGFLRARSQLVRGEPGLFVPIDFGYFNIRLCKVAKRRGWKVLYFVPPGSWRRDKQGKDLPLITDAIVTPFSWSAEILNKMGGKAHFFGHPIKELMLQHDVPVTPVGTIAVLPGSRYREIERNLPLVAATIAKMPELQLEFAVAPTADAAEMRAVWGRLAPGRKDVFTESDTYGVLRRARAGIICSGTATLEAALVRCPLMVIYRVTKAMHREQRLVGFKIPKFISLPNIMLDRELVPEFLCEEIDAGPLQETLRGLVRDEEVRAKQIAGFDEIDVILGPSDAITRGAKLAVELMTTPS